jgi:hypothetical protein
VTVTVTVGGQTGSLANAFTYASPTSPPTVSGVSPNSGSTGGRSGGDVWRDGGDERGSGEWNGDHCYDAGGQCGSGNGDGDKSRGAEREFGERVHLCGGRNHSDYLCAGQFRDTANSREHGEGRVHGRAGCRRPQRGSGGVER